MKKGFTLLELLIVIGIIAILAGAVVVAINPGRQFQLVRNTQRWTAVEAILSATYQRIADPTQGGVFTGVGCTVAIPAEATAIKKTGGFDICPCLVPTYIGALPRDPSVTGGSISDCTTNYDTGYKIMQTSAAGGAPRITVSAPSTEPFTEITTDDISLTR